MKRIGALLAAGLLLFGLHSSDAQVTAQQQPQKISQLPPLPSAATGTELFPCDQVVGGIQTGPYGCSFANISTFVGALSNGVSSYNGRTGAITPILGDLTTAYGAAPGTAFKADQSSTTNKVPSLSGSFTIGHVAAFSDINGTIVDGGALAAGSGTVNTGTANQLAYYATTGAGVSGNANITTPAAGQLQLGVAGAQTGALLQSGATSGTITFQVQPAAGTYNFNWPTAAGTAGQPLLSGGGGTNAQTYGTLGLAAGGTGATTAAAARTNLGLGSASTQITGQSGTALCLLNTACNWSAGQASVPVALTFGATVTPNAALGNVFTLTLTGVVTTFANPTNLPAGQCMVLYLTQDATGGRTITNWGSFWKFPGGTKPTLSSAAGATDVLTGCSSTTSFIATTFTANFQ